MYNVIDEKEKPLMVSIKCLAFNHEKYIRKTLEGFVMQKTKFRFEAIVHDDASTDGTAVIIREYAEKYPDIIKAIFETQNQYSKQDGSLTNIMHNACKGKYIAMCEGDDYWTDPYKLQKQIDFLETHPEFVICSHRYKSYNQKEQTFYENIYPYVNESCSYSLSDLINGKWLAHPLTVVYKKSALDFNHYMKFSMKQDVVLFYSLLKNGYGYLLSDVMAVYRIHDGGVWSHLNEQEKIILEIKQRLAIYEVEKNDIAAEFLYITFYSRPFRKIVLIKNFRIVFNVMKIIFNHKGILNMLRLLKCFFRW